MILCYSDSNISNIPIMENQDHLEQLVEPHDLPENPGLETEDLQVDVTSPLVGTSGDVVDTAADLEKDLGGDVDAPEQVDAD